VTGVFPNSTKEVLKKGVAGVGSLKLVAMFLGMLGSVFIARNLGPDGYGQVIFVISVLHLLATPVSGAMTPLLVRQVSYYSKKGDWARLSQFFRWSVRAVLIVGNSLILLVVCWAVLQFMLGVADEKINLLLVGCVSIMLWAAAARVTGVLQGLGKVVWAQFFDWIVNPLAYLLLLLMLWWFDAMSPLAVLMATLGGLGAAALLGCMVMRQKLPVELLAINNANRLQKEREWGRSWRYFIFLQFITIVNTQTPVILLGIMGSDADVGLYRAAENISSLLSMPLMIMNSVIAHQAASLFVQGETKKMGNLAQQSAILSSAVAFPMAITLLIWGEDILDVLYGSEFVQGYLLLMVLVVGRIVSVSSGPVGLVLNMTSHERITTKALVVSLSANMALCVLLIPTYGGGGAAAGACVSMVLWNAILYFEVIKRLGVRPGIF